MGDKTYDPPVLVQLGIVAVLLMTVVPGAVLAAFDPEPSGDIATAMLAGGAGFAVVVLFAWRFRPGCRLSGRGLLGSTVGLYLAFLVVWVPVFLIGTQWLWNSMGWPIEPQPHLAWFVDPDKDPLVLAGMLGVVCVLGPIAEELVFRGYLQTGMDGVVGKATSLALVSLAFGLIHVGNGWHLLVPLVAMGAFFGWMRERSDGLAAPMLAHVLHNSLTVGVTLAFPEVLSEVYAK